MSERMKRVMLAHDEKNSLMSEWCALRAMALRLSLRDYTPDEVGAAMHDWVDDAVKALKHIESDEKADTSPAPPVEP